MQSLKKSFSKKIAIIGGAVFVLGVVFFCSFGFSAKHVQAQATISGDLHGYAWSSTIGWISMNCAEGGLAGISTCATSNYKVNLSAAGALSGYAWSSNVGWVSFNASDVTANCGEDPHMTASNALAGYAWVMSGTTASGADGCIHLASEYPETVSYGVSYNPSTLSFQGFAWGDVNVGWVSFADVSMASATAPSVDLEISQPSGTLTHAATYTGNPSIPTGSVHLEYTVANVSSCTAVRTSPSPATDWTGSLPIVPGTSPSGGEYVGIPYDVAGTYVYQINCISSSSPSTTVSDSVTITVVMPGGGGGPANVELEINTPAGTTHGPITMTSSAGGPEALSWTSSNVLACTASAGSSGIPDWGTTITSVPVSSTAQSISLPANTTASDTTYVYDISCTPSSGTTPVTDSVAIIVPAPTVPPAEACAVTLPGDYVTASGTSVNVEMDDIGVSWTGAFHDTTLSTDTGTTGFTTTFVDASGSPISSLTALGTTLDMWITGAMPVGTVSIIVNAVPTTPVPGVTSCTPATLYIVPPGGTIPGGGGGTPPRPPWQEI